MELVENLPPIYLPHPFSHNLHQVLCEKMKIFHFFFKSGGYNDMISQAVTTNAFTVFIKKFVISLLYNAPGEMRPL